VLIHGATDNDIHPPRFGGAQRTFGLYRGLARRHDVRVLCVVPNRNRAAGEERADRVTLVRRKSWYTSVAWRLETARMAPMLLAAHGHRASAARLLEALPGAADVFAADLHLTPLFERHPAPLKVYASQNVEADHFAMTGGTRGGGFWTARMRAFEARAVERADLTLVTGEADAARMQALYGIPAARIEVVANGWDETRIRAADASARMRARAALGVADGEYACLFVGSDHAHNRDALRFLLDEVMPALAPHGFRLLAAGDVTRRLDGRREPWLTARADVPDLLPWLDAADAGLNPAVIGGGSNVKLPTFLGAGLATVTTPYGLRGFEPLAPWAVSVPREGMVTALRERPEGWRSRGLPMPEPIAAHAWGVLGARLGDMLEARLAGARPAVPAAVAGGRAGA
jgi:Glycosyl transferase 4-like domain/Glycosyl transferases group 1